MAQETLFDRDEAKRQADAAIGRARNACDRTWMALACASVRRVALTHPEFTTDAVELDLFRQGVQPPSEMRALGAVMVDMARAGVCKATERYERSASRTCHGRPKRVWRSLLRS